LKSAQLNSQLKRLIQVCKDSKNFVKLSVIIYSLTSNKLNEIGIKIGLRPRNTKENETIHEYMTILNEILKNNIEIKLFNKNTIIKIKEIETNFLRKKGNIHIRYIRELVSFYYNLHKIDLPNIYKEFKPNAGIHSNINNLFSLFSPRRNDHNQNGAAFHSLMLQKIKEKESLIQEEFKIQKTKGYFNRQLFESAIRLKKTKELIETNSTEKKPYQGRLIDNMDYQRSLDDILGYAFLGGCILLFLLGITILAEAITFPYLSTTLSIFLLMFFGLGVLIFLVYSKNFKQR
jgi:hypothetical protein